MQRAMPIFLILLALLIVACGGEVGGGEPSGVEPDGGKVAGGEPETRRSSKTAAPREAAVALAPRFEQPQGSWRGLATCRGRDFPLQLDFQAPAQSDPPEQSAPRRSSAQLQFEPALNSSGYATPHGHQITSSLTGEFLPQAGAIEFSVAGDAPRAQSLSLLLSPSADAAVAELAGCEFAVLAPLSSQHPVLQLHTELEALQENPVVTEADMAGECPAPLEAWIARGLAMDLDVWGRGDSSALWSDATARQVFGKPWSDIGAAERKRYFRALMGRCGERGNQARSGVIRQLASLTNYRRFRDDQMRNLESQVINAWQAEFSGIVDASKRGATLTLDDATALRSIPRQFDFAGILGNEFSALSMDADTQRILQDALAGLRNRKVLAELDSAGQDFLRLTARYERALADPDVDNLEARRIVARYLPAAAERYASTADTAQQAEAMAGWLADWPQRESCQTILQSACERAARSFNTRLDTLAKNWAESEKAILEELEDRKTSPETLVAGVNWFTDFEQRYRAVLAFPPFARLQEAGDDWLAELQQDLQETLLEDIRSAKTTPQLRTLETRYFRPGDLQRRDLRRLREALDERVAAAQPFRDSGADAYLNALYNRDFQALRRLDAVLMAGLRSAYGFAATQIALFDELALATTGTRPFLAAINELRSPSALRAAAAVYLLEYEKRYEECLDANAVTFTFTERTDTVTRDGSGFEISRIEGVTTATHYRVKPELAELFRDSFSRPPDAGGERIYRLLFGDSGVASVTSAVRSSMQKHACTAPQIQGLEAGMLAYQRELKRRWSSPD